MKKEKRAGRVRPETVAFPSSFLCLFLLSLPFAHPSLGGPGEKGKGMVARGLLRVALDGDGS